MSDETMIDVRATLQKFQSGYTERNVAKLDEFMQSRIIAGKGEATKESVGTGVFAERKGMNHTVHASKTVHHSFGKSETPKEQGVCNSCLASVKTDRPPDA